MGMIALTDMTYLNQKGYNAAFQKYFVEQNAAMVWPKFASEIPSTQTSERYPWLGEAYWPEQTYGEKAKHGTNPEQSYYLTNVSFDSTMEIEKDAMDDDQYGQIAVRLREQAGNFARWFQYKLAATIEAGNATKAYDGGTYYFDNDHYDVGAKYGTTYSNLKASALSVGNLQTIWKEMMVYKDGQGHNRGITPTGLIVPPQLMFTAMEIAKSQYYPAGLNVGTGTTVSYGNVNKANVLNGAFEVIVVPDLTSATYSYLFDGSKNIKPFFIQKRKEIEYKFLGPGSEYAIEKKKYLSTAEWRGNFGYTDPRLCYALQP